MLREVWTRALVMKLGPDHYAPDATAGCAVASSNDNERSNRRSRPMRSALCARRARRHASSVVST
jgi:hypothetical protein